MYLWNTVMVSSITHTLITTVIYMQIKITELKLMEDCRDLLKSLKICDKDVASHLFCSKYTLISFLNMVTKLPRNGIIFTKYNNIQSSPQFANVPAVCAAEKIKNIWLEIGSMDEHPKDKVLMCSQRQRVTYRSTTWKK